jgi:hypothetical protein
MIPNRQPNRSCQLGERTETTNQMAYMKYSIKLTIIAFVVCLMASMTTIKAQYWDIQPNIDRLYLIDEDGNPYIFPYDFTASYYQNGAGYGQDVYFLSAGHVCRWNASSGWQSIGGVDAGCLTIQGHFLYIGGAFTQILATDIHGEILHDGNNNPIVLLNATNTAKYDLDQHVWHQAGAALPSASLSDVLAITVDAKENIYVSADDPLFPFERGRSLVKWDGSQWAAIGGGLLIGVINMIEPPLYKYSVYEPYISALATDGTNIFVAGGFVGASNNIGGTLTLVPSHGIIKWDATTTPGHWVQMGGNNTQTPIHALWAQGPVEADFTGIFGSNNIPEVGNDLISAPYSIAIVGTNLFVVGPIAYPHGGIARFSTVSGNLLPCDDLMSNGGDGKLGVVTQNGKLYVAGPFDHVGSLAANSIACWTNDGSANGSWSNLGLGLQDINGDHIFMAANSDSVFVTGSFYSAGGKVLPIMPFGDRIARWSTVPPTVRFTGGSISAQNIFDGPVAFSFNVTGTPDSVWTVSSWSGIYGGSDTIQLDSNGNGSFTDYNAAIDGPYQFYQLAGNQGVTSQVFGYTNVTVNGNNGGGFEFQNPLIPLAPGTINSVLNTFWDDSGNPYIPPSDGSINLWPYGDPYDHIGGWNWWRNQWTWDCGDTITCGPNDLIWLSSSFPSGYLITFIGYLPQ